MPHHAGYHRIYAKRTPHLDEEKLLKRKQQHANSSPASVSPISAVAQTTVQRAKTSPQNLSAQEMRQLQFTIGNHAVAQMIAPQKPHMSIRPMLQRSPISIKQSATPMTLVQRWKWPWRRGETDQQRLERYDKTRENIKTAIDVLRVGHGVVMLPLTVIDLISNIARPFTGNKVKPKSSGTEKEQNRKAFHNAINGESQLVSLMGGKRGVLDLKILKYMPWNIIPWIIGALSRWATKLNKKYLDLKNKMDNINVNQVGNGLN